MTFAVPEGDEHPMPLFDAFSVGFVVAMIPRVSPKASPQALLFVAVGDGTTNAHIIIAAANERDRDFWTNKCDKLETDIETAVYDLYGLTPDEIRLIENS